MSTLFSIALTTGILSGIWGWVSISMGLLTWAGFLGCTSYFASPNDSIKGLLVSMFTNLTGVFWAMVIIKASQYASIEVLGFVATGLVSFMMCIQAKKEWLSYIPGTFIGCCATFAANGAWLIVIASLLLGGCFGYAMKSTGLWLNKRSNLSRQSGKHAASLK